MRLRYLPANQAWCFALGLQTIRLDGWPIIFNTREEAVEAARQRGLIVTKGGSVEVAR